MNQNLFSQLKQSLRELVSGRQTQEPVTRTVVVKVEKTVHQEQSNLQSPKSLSSEPEPQSAPSSEQPQNEELIVLPSDNPFALKQFTELHTDLVFKYLLKRIRMAVREDMPSVNLFQFGNTRKLAQIARPEYETQLNSLMDYFVKKEDYELAARCRDTLTRHKQNEGRRPS
jgi:hypothetical protein